MQGCFRSTPLKHGGLQSAPLMIIRKLARLAWWLRLARECSSYFLLMLLSHPLIWFYWAGIQRFVIEISLAMFPLRTVILESPGFGHPQSFESLGIFKLLFRWNLKLILTCLLFPLVLKSCACGRCSFGSALMLFFFQSMSLFLKIRLFLLV